MTCWARTPCGVLVAIRTPGWAAVSLTEAQPPTTAVAVAITVASATARRGNRRVLSVRVGSGNVEHDLEFEEL
jgi:hypothetical protein